MMGAARAYAQSLAEGRGVVTEVVSRAKNLLDFVLGSSEPWVFDRRRGYWRHSVLDLHWDDKNECWLDLKADRQLEGVFDPIKGELYDPATHAWYDRQASLWYRVSSEDYWPEQFWSVRTGMSPPGYRRRIYERREDIQRVLRSKQKADSQEDLPAGSEQASPALIGSYESPALVTEATVASEPVELPSSVVTAEEVEPSVFAVRETEPERVTDPVSPVQTPSAARKSGRKANTRPAAPKAPLSARGGQAETKPSVPQATQVEQAIFLFHQGRVLEAIAKLEAIAELEPDNTAAWQLLGKCFTCLGQHEAAIAAHDRVLAIEPLSATGWYDRALAQFRMGKINEALASYDRLLEIDPKHALGWAGKAMSLERLGHNEDAVQCYARAAELDPLNAESWLDRGAAINSHTAVAH